MDNPVIVRTVCTGIFKHIEGHSAIVRHLQAYSRTLRHAETYPGIIETY